MGARVIAPLHPGHHLAELLAEHEISQYRLAKTIGVTQRRVSRIVRGEGAITADTALRLSRAFGTTPEFWLNLQMHYELECAGDVGPIAPLIEHEAA